MTDAKTIASNFVVMNREFAADVVGVTDTLYTELDKNYDGFAGHLLISSHSFDADWPTWEVHPEGDEFVVLMDGEAEMVFATGHGDETVRLEQPGSFVIVPKGTWHTARVQRAATMLFITPGEGTENRTEPDRSGS